MTRFLYLVRSLFYHLQQDETKKDRDDIALVDRTLRALARELGYRVVMSLANSKKAGSAALIK